MTYYDEDDLFLQYQAENTFNMQQERERLNQMSDKRFIDEIVFYHNPKYLNSIVDDNKFRAYDIAKRIKLNGWTPTEKQRLALTNVYLHAQYDEH